MFIHSANTHPKPPWAGAALAGGRGGGRLPGTGPRAQEVTHVPEGTAQVAPGGGCSGVCWRREWMGDGRSGGRAATGTRDASRDSWDWRGLGVGRDAGGGLVGFPGVSRGGDRMAPSQVTVSFRSDSQGPRRAQVRPAEGRRRGKACGLKPPPPPQPPSSAQLPPAFSAHGSLWRAAICPARPRRSLQARPGHTVQGSASAAFPSVPIGA